MPAGIAIRRRPGLIRRDRGSDGELASRGERARAEVSWSGSPRLWRGLVTLFLVLMVVFSVIPLTIDLLGEPNKDYSLWYQVGVVIRQGMNIYPEPRHGPALPVHVPALGRGGPRVLEHSGQACDDARAGTQRTRRPGSGRSRCRSGWRPAARSRACGSIRCSPPCRHSASSP